MVPSTEGWLEAPSASDNLAASTKDELAAKPFEGQLMAPSSEDHHCLKIASSYIKYKKIKCKQELVNWAGILQCEDQ